jgi:hypothetical protein
MLELARGLISTGMTSLRFFPYVLLLVSVQPSGGSSSEASPAAW